MSDAGIGIILGPDQLRVYPSNSDAWGIGPYALDNGAWGAFTGGLAFDGASFWRVLERWGRVWQSSQRPDFAVLPDIVGGGLDSLALSVRWLPYVRQYAPPMLAVQDGMEPEDVEEYIGPSGAGCGIFVGGSTAWKWATIGRWAAMAKTYRAPIHVGRVNSTRGIMACRAHGVTSCDGTSASRFSVNAAALGAACHGRYQVALPVPQ
jgi:hypothetical protein